MNYLFRFVFALMFLFLIDFYVFRTLKLQFENLSKSTANIIYIAHWMVPVVLIVFVVFFIINLNSFNNISNKYFLIIGGIFVLFYLPKLIIVSFQLFEDFSKIIAFFTKKLSSNNSVIYESANNISRSVFIGRIGLLIAAIPFISILYGIIKGRFSYDIVEKRISFKNLPSAFNGFKIVQFSDLHIGSFLDNKEQVIKAIDLINLQNPDVVLFTGDMVNNKADELDGWENILNKINAKFGVYSVLGNHDYGEYVKWTSLEEKKANIDDLINRQKEMGFKLLLNNSEIIGIDGEQIAIIGVENWGKPPFPQYGKLNQACENVKDIPFKILMSHDPTHWEEEVLGKKNIALTLSGHTHGMQLAINFAGINWSPVKWKYNRWRGLYKENNQYLYVNIGLGFIAFPGRVGTNPEITVIELQKS
ncbi:MAG: metallophosphoesterase [Bacteroidales bacterium]|nr:metallophosphoesterase [Bacteroidales bacterium]